LQAALRASFESLLQNLFISAPTLSQQARLFFPLPFFFPLKVKPSHQKKILLLRKSKSSCQKPQKDFLNFKSRGSFAARTGY
jgi:hypothetical protein